MSRPFAVVRTRGPHWDDSKSLEEQVDWPAHADFMEALAADGFVVLGGPLEGTRDVLLVIDAESQSEIVERLSADPWAHRLLVVKECWPWQIRLGSLD